jgi:cytochrome P450
VQIGRICFTTWYANTPGLACSPHWSQSQSGEELPEAERPSFEDTAQNGMLAIIAGSDTTSSVLTAIIYYLLLNPAAYEHLQEEVDSAFPNGEEPLDAVKLSHLRWLNGCM